MTREIKFRIICQNEILGYERLTENGWEWMALDLNPKDKEIWHKGTFVDSDSYKLIRSQFTGLKDKNDTEIYNGDLLRLPPNNKWEEQSYSCYEVFFHDGDANSDYNIGYSINRMHHHGSVCGGYIPAFKPKQVSKMIVIGNIFENAELLNTKP